MQNAEFYREDSGETVSPRRIQRGGLWGFSGMALQVEAIGGEARAQRGEGTWQGAASSASTALPCPASPVWVHPVLLRRQRFVPPPNE